MNGQIYGSIAEPNRKTLNQRILLKPGDGCTLEHGFRYNEEDYQEQRESEVRKGTIISRTATNGDPNVLATSSKEQSLTV